LPRSGEQTKGFFFPFFLTPAQGMHKKKPYSPSSFFCPFSVGGGIICLVRFATLFFFFFFPSLGGDVITPSPRACGERNWCFPPFCCGEFFGPLQPRRDQKHRFFLFFSAQPWLANSVFDRPGPDIIMVFFFFLPRPKPWSGDP